MVTVGAIVAVNGCGDSTGIRASLTNQDNKPTVYALNGTPSTVPTVLRIRSGSVGQIDPTFSFDLAFDLNAAGEVVVYTVRAVASELAGVHRVGLKATTLSFEEALEAPTKNYEYDSLRVVPIGQTVFVEAVDAFNCSQFSFLGQNIRAKMRIDSVNTAARILYLHVLSNPNCGFKSLVPGGELPKD